MNNQDLNIIRILDIDGNDNGFWICQGLCPSQEDIDEIVQIYMEECIINWDANEIVDELSYRGFDLIPVNNVDLKL